VVRHVGDPKQNWAAFQADPDWIDAKARSIANGEIVDRIESIFMTPTDFSRIS
jgi:hypothetical protein